MAAGALWLMAHTLYQILIAFKPPLKERKKKKKGFPNKRSLYLVSRKTLLDKHFSFIPLLSITGANCWPEQKNKSFRLLPQIFLLCKMIEDAFSSPMFSPVFITFCIWKRQMCVNGDHLNSRTPTFCQELLFPTTAPEQLMFPRLAPLLRTFSVSLVLLVTGHHCWSSPASTESVERFQRTSHKLLWTAAVFYRAADSNRVCVRLCVINSGGEVQSRCFEGVLSLFSFLAGD